MKYALLALVVAFGSLAMAESDSSAEPRRLTSIDSFPTVHQAAIRVVVGELKEKGDEPDHYTAEVVEVIDGVASIAIRFDGHPIDYRGFGDPCRRCRTFFVDVKTFRVVKVIYIR